MEEHNISESDVIQTLLNMFKDVMNESAIRAIVESCEGDLNESVEAIMNITTEDRAVNTLNYDLPPSMNDHTESPQSTEGSEIPGSSPITNHSPEHSQTNTCPDRTSPGIINHTSETTTEIQPMPQMLTSYAKAIKTTGAIPKRRINKISSSNKYNKNWNDHIKNILTTHNQGTQILILMRGPSGSGKSYLAKQIIEMTIGNNTENFQNHIFSTDSFFINASGYYDYKKHNLSYAHMWNQSRVNEKLKIGVSPVIVDNTNIEIWEMESYIRMGVNNGYVIEIVESNTPWTKNAQVLASKSVHKVPLSTIKHMLLNYKRGITSDYLIKYFKLSYPYGLNPPVLRKIPPVSNKSEHYDLKNKKSKMTDNDILEKSTGFLISDEMNLGLDNVTFNHEKITTDLFEQKGVEITTGLSKNSTENDFNDNELNENHINEEHNENILKLDRQFVETTKIEEVWENGESWTDKNENSNNSVGCLIDLEPQERREKVAKPNNEIKSLADFRDQDWKEISMFLSPWTNNKTASQNTCVSEVNVPTVTTTTIGTSIDIGDTNTDSSQNILKILNATPRDINIFHIPSGVEKIPNKRMLDKSSMTNENVVSIDNINLRCQNEEKHFKAFRKLFKDKNKSSLRDIFDNCCGDVNWAVHIVLDGMKNDELNNTENNDSSDSESDSEETCNCLATYELIPNTTFDNNISDKNLPNTNENNISSPQKKQKKDKSIPSEISSQLKKQIEKNVIIPDSHYSQHCLNIRKMRHGEFITPNSSHELNDIDESENVDESALSIQASAADKTQLVDETINEEYLSDSSSLTSDSEKSENVNVGIEFLTELDRIFGRNIVYPKGILPKMTIPISMLNKLNALWIESMMAQMDDQTRQSDQMLQQDEELAKQLAMKEEELALAGQEPEMPDFKEIMDMDFALSLYRKDVSEWRNQEPNDLAAKMTREKLFNLFPEVSKDLLSELLMAYDNNFQNTVEDLLSSMGKSEILSEKNGVNKFVMQREMERKETILKEEKKALSDTEWPLLPQGTVDMGTVNEYRDKAECHLQYRNECINKVQKYISQGMTQVANYYTDVANFHKMKFEQSNSLAALTLVHLHMQNSSNAETLDLHHLRVNEARESLDLFVDSHIRNLIENQSTGGMNSTVLFFVTGRGLHSIGGPRVKPAVKRRLIERGLSYNMVNPGLISARITVHSKLTYQLP